MEDTQLLVKYQDQIQEHINNEEFKDAIRKVNNVLDSSPFDLENIKNKILLLLFLGEIDKAQEFMSANKSFLS